MTEGNGASHHAEYEMVFEAKGTLEEKDAPNLKQEGVVRVIQGPKQHTVSTLDGDTLVYAFLSVNEVNVPLVPDQAASRVSPHCYKICVPSREFTITFDPASVTEELMEEFEKILQWFVTYQGAPAGKTCGGGTTAATAEVGDTPQGPQGRLSLAGRFEAAGAKGVAFVEKVAGQLDAKVSGAIDPHLESARAAEVRGEAKEVKIGGKVTSRVLGTTRGAVGAVAGATNTVSEKASDVVGSVLGKNPIMKKLGKAEEGTKRFRFHRTLTAGMVAVGNVYVTADERGRQIVTTAGENSAEVLRTRYGEEVSGAATDTTHIAMDSYRIMRFPAKFGASALLKGAAKATVANSAKQAKS